VITLKPSTCEIELGTPVIESNYSVKSHWNPGSTGSVYTITVTGMPATNGGDLTCNIKIPIVTPTNSHPITVSISGKIGLELAVVPSVVSLPVSDTVLTRTFKMRLLGGVQALDPSQIKMPVMAGVEFQCARDNDGRSLLTTITFSPEFTKQLQADVATTINFSVPGAGAATLTCRAKRQHGN